ncbi:MAG: hypothetical protein R3B81_01700 [bacterium]
MTTRRFASPLLLLAGGGIALAVILHVPGEYATSSPTLDFSVRDTLAVRYGAGTVPLRFTREGHLDEARSVAVRARVATLLGREPAELSVAEGIFDDDFPFGDVCEHRSAILARVEGVTIEDPWQGAHSLPMTLVFDQEVQTLLAAYTDPKETWVLPQRDKWIQRPDSLAGRTILASEVTPLRAGTKLRHTLPDIMGVVWAVVGDPRTVGQIVVRPRSVDSWVRPPGDDGPHFLDVPEPTPSWAVHVSGFVADTAENNYLSSEVLFFCDDDPRYYFGYGLP